MPLKHQPRNLCDIAKATLGQLGRIQAREQILGQIVRGKQILLDKGAPFDRIGRQQFEAVIVHRNRKRAGRVACRSPCEQRTDAHMRHAAGERITKQVMTFA